MKKQTVLAIILLCVGFIIVFHHYIENGRFYDLKDMLHHEFFEAVFFTVGGTLLLNGFFTGKCKESQ